MKRLCSAAGLRDFVARERNRGRRIALVPTLGGLHPGHLSLVAEARRRADTTIVSIFLNPTQFGPEEDLDRYPQDLDADLAACRAAAVAAVFTPSREELYPQGSDTAVQVGALATPLCGASRPHHFRGVATVVAKLLIAAQPHVAVFGAKDYQQLLVVRRLARDLLLDVEIASAPIAREPDGLAYSSRNHLLSPAARAEAPALARALGAAERALADGERNREALRGCARREIARAESARVDYIELRDPRTLAEVPRILSGAALLALAVFFPAREGEHRVRLIDNRLLNLPAAAPARAPVH